MREGNIIKRGSAGYIVYYNELNSNTTLEKSTNWDIDTHPRFIDIDNRGTSSLSFEINDDGVVITVESGYTINAYEIYPYIEKVVILATGDFIVAIRR